MNNLDKLEEMFHSIAPNLHQQPSEQAWQTLAKRLEANKQLRRRVWGLFNNQLIMAAASIALLLLVTGVTIFAIQQHQQLASAKQEIAALKVLTTDPNFGAANDTLYIDMEQPLDIDKRMAEVELFGGKINESPIRPLIIAPKKPIRKSFIPIEKELEKQYVGTWQFANSNAKVIIQPSGKIIVGDEEYSSTSFTFDKYPDGTLHLQRKDNQEKWILHRIKK
ncbi:MAG: hypothetical protein KA974_05315 [Saprospiraceae bacterium]|nr:hypothetical protein [Saprospiraceae bacterium]MBP7679782.1 hypothetical protein [Saprospiraceae bacterium]